MRRSKQRPDRKKFVGSGRRSPTFSFAGHAPLAMICAYKSIAELSGRPAGSMNGKEIYMPSKYFRLDSEPNEAGLSGIDRSRIFPPTISRYL
jgi:hypothetical protein